MARILIPVDYSEASRNALSWAIQFNDVLEEGIAVLRVKDIPHGVEPLPEGVMKELKHREVLAEKQSLERFIISATRSNGLNGNGITTEVLFGNPGEEIVRFAEGEKIDWIILGLRRKYQFYERLFGTVSSYVLKNSPCPVIYVPEQAGYHPPRKIALASDLFLSEEESYSRLRQLAKNFNSEVQRVFVNEVESDSLRQKEEVFYTSADQVGQGFPGRIVMIRDSSVLSGLDYYISKHSTDLLAVYLPHREGLERFIHPSFSRKLLFHSTIPLLMFREDHCV